MSGLSARLVRDDERRIRALLTQSLRNAGISAFALVTLAVLLFLFLMLRG